MPLPGRVVHVVFRELPSDTAACKDNQSIFPQTTILKAADRLFLLPEGSCPHALPEPFPSAACGAAGVSNASGNRSANGPTAASLRLQIKKYRLISDSYTYTRSQLPGRNPAVSRFTIYLRQTFLSSQKHPSNFLAKATAELLEAVRGEALLLDASGHKRAFTEGTLVHGGYFTLHKLQSLSIWRLAAIKLSTLTTVTLENIRFKKRAKIFFQSLQKIKLKSDQAKFSSNTEGNKRLHKSPQRFCFCQSDLYNRPSDAPASHRHHRGEKSKPEMIPVNVLPELQQNHPTPGRCTCTDTRTEHAAHLAAHQLNLPLSLDHLSHTKLSRN